MGTPNKPNSDWSDDWSDDWGPWKDEKPTGGQAEAEARVLGEGIISKRITAQGALHKPLPTGSARRKA